MLHRQTDLSLHGLEEPVWVSHAFSGALVICLEVRILSHAGSHAPLPAFYNYWGRKSKVHCALVLNTYSPKVTCVTSVHISLARTRHLAAPKFQRIRKHSLPFCPEGEANFFGGNGSAGVLATATPDLISIPKVI